MSETLIRSFRHLECQNPSIISQSIGIPNGSEKMGKKVRNTEHGGGTRRRNLIHIEEDVSINVNKFLANCSVYLVE